AYSDVKDELASGNVWIAQCYSGDAALLGLEDENIRYFIPDEGAPLWIDNFVIAKDSEKLGAAHQFINFCLQAEVAAQCADFAWYATPNGSAKPMLDAELLADDALFPSEEVMARCAFSDMNVQVERERVLNNAMNELYAAIRKLEVVPDGKPAVTDGGEGSEAQAAAVLD
ncbi:MAG: extracellular solute-binding protein, partial [Verrucomicrobiales bacterium]|nr:extracellular solute-binding protein [Verrucomicrobiales bacterium]